MNNYKELKIWHKSMDLVEKVYTVTNLLPKEEKYSLISQIRRSAISIPSNIAEGAGRNSNKEFRNFLGIANGSINELNTQLLLSLRIGYLTKETIKRYFQSSNRNSKNEFCINK